MSGTNGNVPAQPTYLVAGATGVIGRRLTEALLADDVNVRALVRNPETAREILGPMSSCTMRTCSTTPTSARRWRASTSPTSSFT